MDFSHNFIIDWLPISIFEDVLAEWDIFKTFQNVEIPTAEKEKKTVKLMISNMKVHLPVFSLFVNFYVVSLFRVILQEIVSNRELMKCLECMPKLLQKLLGLNSML